VNFSQALASLYPVTPVTRRDNIAPFRLATVPFGDHMIESEVLRFKPVPAILALEVVPRINICSRKLDVLFPVLYVSEKTQNSRKFDGKGN
jgi:hypothetical protein